MLKTVAIVLALGITPAQAQSNTSAFRIPAEWTYLLPQPFNSTLEYSWLNTTTTGNSSITDTLRRASHAPFVSYSDEFTAIVGDNATTHVIECPPDDPMCSFEAGVWLPESNVVWFTYRDFDYPYNQTITAFDLNNYTSFQVTTNPPIRYPLGGYLYKGKVYFTEFSLPTYPATIITVDPKTLAVEPILNSYQGIPLAPCDDVCVTHRNGKDYVFFTTFGVRQSLGDKFPRQQYESAVWRWDVADKLLTPVVSNTEIKAPNGIRASPDGRTLYITDTVYTHPDQYQMEAYNGTQSNSIYAYDINDDGVPVNGRLFGLVRTGIANGLHIDEKGRVWTCENDGITVRSPKGRTLGSFNVQAFRSDNKDTFIGNFALAGNKVVIGNITSVIVYEIAEQLIDPSTDFTS